MRKCKDRKILAMILAASMIFQSVPSVAIALEETTAAVSQNEEGKEAEQGKEQKAEEKTEQETSQETEQKQETEKEQESTQGMACRRMLHLKQRHSHKQAVRQSRFRRQKVRQKRILR